MGDFEKMIKLNHDNWNTWSKLMRAHLTIKDVFFPIINEKPEPLEVVIVPAAVADDVEVVRARERALVRHVAYIARQKDIEQWEKADKMATMFMTLAVESNQLIHFHDINSAKATWDLLKLNNTNHSRGSKMHKLETILNMKFYSGDCMKSHLNKICAEFEELREMGFVLSSLNTDPDFNSVVSAIYAWSDDRITLTEVKAKLNEESDRISQQQISSLHYNKKHFTSNNYFKILKSFKG
jgi:hypothetical protein